MLKRSAIDAQKHLERYSSWQLKAPLNLQPSSLDQTSFFHLSKNMHPFFIWLLTGVLGLVISATLFTYGDGRAVDSQEQAVKPAVSVFLVQVLSSAVGMAFVFVLVVQPFSTALLLPQQGFLWMVSLALMILVVSGSIPTGSASVGGIGLVMRNVAVILAVIVAVYFLRPTILELIQEGRFPVLWMLSTVLLLGGGRFAWNAHRQAVVQLAHFHSLPLNWVWVLTGLGVLGGLVLSVQVWVQGGWPALSIAAGIMYAVVFMIAGWIASSRSDNITERSICSDE